LGTYKNNCKVLAHLKIHADENAGQGRRYKSMLEYLPTMYACMGPSVPSAGHEE
jgi:hypothetical protein